jgi:hypothetical protein
MELVERRSSCIRKFIYAKLVACFWVHLMFTRQWYVDFNRTRNVAIELPKIPNMYGTLEEVETSSELHKSQGEHLLVFNI